MDVDGTIDQRFGPVRDAFGDVIRAQPGTGAAVAAWVDGAWVADLWGGWADEARTRAWRRDNIAMPYSVSKPFAALCALVLVDRERWTSTRRCSATGPSSPRRRRFATSS